MGIALCVANLISGCFGFYQNERSQAIMAKFKDFIPLKATVIRNGETIQIDAADLVPGDIVIVSTGERVPADIRIINSNEMKVDNSSLTGESEPQPRETHSTKEKIFEAENMAFFGTTCVDGKGIGIVVLTGSNTVLGGVADLANSAIQGESTFNRDMQSFTLVITIIALTFGIAFFLLGFIIGTSAINGIVNAIGIFVANVPEGLPITLTVTLAATAQTLSKKKVLCKNLTAVETLGSTSCICTDKTGTLTQNCMTPAHAFVTGKLYDCTVAKDEIENKEYEKTRNYADAEFIKFAEYIAMSSVVEILDPTDQDIKEQICKDLNLVAFSDLIPTQFEEHKERARLNWLRDTPYRKRHTTLGNPTESGIVKFIASLIDIKEIRSKYQKVHEIPFKSAIKYSVTVRRITDPNSENFSHNLMIMKGAAEKILERCDKVRTKEGVISLNDKSRLEIASKNTEFASRGERVIGLAYLDLDNEKFPDNCFNQQSDHVNDIIPTSGLVFFGLISLFDPPRERVEFSVDKCKTAGVKIIMLTGDQPDTAKAIAHQCHIISDLSLEYSNMISTGMDKEEAFRKCKAIVIHGDELLRMHHEDLKRHSEDPEKELYLQQWLSKKEIVFARLNPAQKLIIVRACQDLGYVVAVTGDGVNDTPAIEQANIGIAMGSGSDVAKDAADMVLLSDDFSSIVDGVEEGRLIFDNMKKSIAYTLTSNTPELFPFLFYIIFQVPLPLTTLLILGIDLGCDLWPAISFSYDQQEQDLMKRKPRNPERDKLVNFKLISFAYLQLGVIECAATLFVYFTVMKDYGFYPANLFFFAFDQGCENNGELRKYDWMTTKDAKLTMQEFYGNCSKINGTARSRPDFWVPIEDTLGTISTITGQPVRYTSEALKHAHTSVWVSIVMMQISCQLSTRFRSISIWEQKFSNISALYGIIFELILATLFTYVPFLNIALGTRPLDGRHFLVNAFPFFAFVIIYDELRRFFMMRLCKFEKGKKPEYSWLYKWTYY